jgi:hypothetical protein
MQTDGAFADVLAANTSYAAHFSSPNSKHAPRRDCEGTGRAGDAPSAYGRFQSYQSVVHNAPMAVTGPRDPGASPVVLLRELQDLVGDEAVARWCADLLAGRASYDDPQLPPLGWFGTGAANALQRGDVEARGQDYWVRTWAARGLLHGWNESAADVA